MVWSRQFAYPALVLLALLLAGCGGGGEATGGASGANSQGPGAAEVVCGLGCLVIFLAIPVGIVLLVLRGRSKRTSPPPSRAEARSEGGLRIFVSYRRSDSQDATGRIYDALVARFAKTCVFKDVDSIPLGEDFRRVLQEAIMRADVVIVVIGPRWFNARDTAGRRRLDDENDFVRIEIETALAQGIPVIPVLVSNAKMITAASLPASLAQLAYRNALPVRPDPDFHRDIDRLVAALQRLAPPSKDNKPAGEAPKSEAPRTSSAGRSWLVGCAVAGAAILLLLFLLAVVGAVFYIVYTA